MKKTAILGRLCAFVIFAFTLTGCGGLKSLAPTSLDLDKAYEFSAEVEYGKSTVTADFQRMSADCWNVSVTEPYEIQGLTFYYREGKTKAAFGGITVDLTDTPYVSDTAKTIVNAIESAIKNEGTEITKKDKETIEVTGKTDAGDYVLLLDSKTHLPISATVADKGFTVIFKEVNADALDDGMVSVQ